MYCLVAVSSNLYFFNGISTQQNIRNRFLQHIFSRYKKIGWSYLPYFSSYKWTRLFIHYPLLSQLAITAVDFNTDTQSPVIVRLDQGRSTSQKWIEYNVPQHS